MTTQQISTADLQGANLTLDLLTRTLRELRGHGVNPPVEDMVRACIDDDGDVMRALARCSLLLALAVNRLADG